MLGLVLIGLFGLGAYMSDLPFPQRLKLYNWHKWTGVAVLALSLVRLLWRLSHRPPARRRGTGHARLAKWAHHGTHAALCTVLCRAPGGLGLAVQRAFRVFLGLSHCLISFR